MPTSGSNVHFDKDLVRTALAGHWVACLADLTGATPEQITTKAGPCWICGKGDDRYSADSNINQTGGAFCRVCGGSGGFTLLAKSRRKALAGSVEFNDCAKWLVEAGIATQGDLRSQNKPREDVINMQSNQNGDAKAKPKGVDATAAESLNSEALPAPILHDKLPVFANAKEAAKAYCEPRPSDSVHLYHQTPDLCSFVYTSRIHGEREAKSLGIGSLFRPIHKTSAGWQGSLQMRTGRPLYAKYPRLLSGYRRVVASSNLRSAGSLSINFEFENVADLTDANCVYVCEDERDADAILAMGLNATTTSGGQSSIGMTDLQGLSGKRLILLPKLHEHHHAYIRQFRGVVEASVPGVTISVKCLSDDKTFTSDRGFGADDWLQNYLREAKLHDDQDELLSDELERLREKLVRILEELPDHSEDDTFAPEKLGPIALQPADHSKKLHNGPLAAVSAAIFGLLSNDVISERRPPDRHFLYFTGPEHHEDELLFVSLRWDLSESEAAANRHGNKKVIRQIARVEGGWQCRNPYNVGRPLYKLHEPIEGVTAADSDVVFVSEGEPACDSLRSIGLPAVSLSQGAASPRKTDLSPLNGKTVTWLPDHDEAGEKFVRACRDQMDEQAPDATVIVKCLSDDPDFGAVIKPGDDAVDWLEFHKDKTPAQLRNIIESLPDRSDEPRFWSTEDKLARIPLPSAKKLTATRQDELNELLCTCDLASGDAKVQAELAVCAFAIKHGVSKEETEEHWSSHGGGTSTDHLHTIWAQAAKAFRQNALEKLEGKSSSKRQESSTRISAPADEQGPTKNNASKKDDASSMDYATTGIAFLTINYRRKIAAKEHCTLVHWNGSFHEWSGAWRQIEDAKIESEVWHYIDETYERFSDSDVRNVVAAIRRKCYQSNEISYNTWSSGVDRGFRIAVDDGSLLDPARGTIEDPSPDWFSRTILPIAYDKNAKCELWEKILLQNLEGDMDRYKLLQEFAGYCLWSKLTFQKFLILLGEGANGKSVFLAGLSALLGLDNISNCNLESLTSNRFATVTTLGCLANLSAEISNVDRASEGVLKQLSSGDIMPFEQKHKPIVYAKPTAKLIFSCNDMPRFTDKSFGLYRRMIVVPFNREVPEHERIHDLDKPHRWKDELPGMLNWAIEGLQRLLEQKQFTYSEVCQAALTDYKFESNPAAAFLEERVIPDERPNVRILKQDLYDAYSNWCGHHGRRRLGDGEFAKEVRRKFKVSDARPSIDGLRQRVWRGIRMLSLKEQRERLDDEEAESQLDQLQRDLD